MTTERELVSALLDVPVIVDIRGGRVLIVSKFHSRATILEAAPYSPTKSAEAVARETVARLNAHGPLVEALRAFIVATIKAPPGTLSNELRVALTNGHELLRRVGGE